MATYSICITCLNEAETIRQSLDSILNQIDDDFEVVVVDSLSNDGSLEVLQGYAGQNLIKLIVKKCSRGRGRQIAFVNSSGKYVISHMDLDDVFKPELKALLRMYHSRCEGYLLCVNKPPNWGGLTVGTRALIADVGGWRDLQYAEDWDLWARAAKMGRFRVFNYELRETICSPDSDTKSVYRRLTQRYIRYRELYRLGRNVFAPNEKTTLAQKLTARLAYLASLFHSSFHDPFNKSFDPWSEAYLEK